jgi:hypothetical protein
MTTCGVSGIAWYRAVMTRTVVGATDRLSVKCKSGIYLSV